MRSKQVSILLLIVVFCCAFKCGGRYRFSNDTDLIISPNPVIPENGQVKFECSVALPPGLTKEGDSLVYYIIAGRTDPDTLTQFSITHKIIPSDRLFRMEKEVREPYSPNSDSIPLIFYIEVFNKKNQRYVEGPLHFSFIKNTF